MSSSLDYHAWQRQRVPLPGQVVHVATKPGVFGYGHEDPSAVMLASSAVQSAGKRVLSLACGNGLVGAAATVGGAATVWMADRHQLAIEASARTLGFLAPSPAARLAAGHGRSAFTDATEHAGTFDAAYVRVVPERVAMLQLLWDALVLLAPGGRVYIAGANDEGVKPAAKWLEAVCGAVRVEAQRGGHRMVSAKRPTAIDMASAIPDAQDRVWMDPMAFRELPIAVGSIAFALCTRPGVFSWEHLDEASADLLGVLSQEAPVAAGAAVLDLGCGAGVLGTFVALRDPSCTVTMVDVDTEAVRCADETIARAGASNARAMAGDVASGIDGPFDVIVSNPPFHVGKHTALDVPRQFIRDAYARLRSGGVLWLVANRTLPYEVVLHEVFGHAEMVRDGSRFKVLRARRR